MKKQIIIVAAALGLIVTGCQGGTSTSLIKEVSTSTTAETTEVETEPETEAWSVEQDLALYNTYININNFMVGRINDSLERYFSFVEFQEEFANKKENYYCYSLSDDQIEDVKDAYAVLEIKHEKTELDEAFLQMYPSIMEVMKCLNDIEEYTEMKSYLDDDYSKGKELHTVLWNCINEYTETGDVFMNALSAEADIRRTADLQKLKDEGYEMMYTINCVMDSAQAIQTELFDQEVDDQNILEMDMEKIQPLYEEFVANVERAMELSENKEAMQREGFGPTNGSWMLFERSMKDTKTSITEVLDKVRQGKPLSQSDLLPVNISGQCSLTSYYAGISDMIKHYNLMIRY